MQIRKAFRYELMPKGEHIRKMKQYCGCARFVFNRALAYQKAQYESDNSVKFSYTRLANRLPEWKRECGWLKACHSQILQQSLKDLESAYRNFFAKRADFPKFRRKGIRDSIRYPQGIKLEERNSRIYLPKIGWIRYRKSRDITGKIKNVTVSQRAGKWYVSIQTEYETEEPVPTEQSAVGIDMGIIRFATLSDGTYYEPVNSFRHHQEALRKAQRSMSRKEKFSSNWQKARTKVRKIHSRIADIRKDYLHKISTAISKSHAMVCMEDLQVRNMSGSASGTRESPGRNVRAKSGLNKSILDQGWYEFRRQLEYKLAWRGGILIAVPPQNAQNTRTCPICGSVTAENRKTQARFRCVTCGFEENADVVGAINILRAGHARLACEVSDAARSPAAGTHRRDQSTCVLTPQESPAFWRGGCQMKIDNSITLGKSLKKIRHDLGLTQSQLALSAGVGVRFIVDLEAGKSTIRFRKCHEGHRSLGSGITLVILESSKRTRRIIHAVHPLCLVLFGSCWHAFI